MSIPALSDRELKIAAFVAKGYSDRDKTEELELTEQIVKNVVHSLFERLGVRNRVELANYFCQGSSSEAIETALGRIEQQRVRELRRQKILDISAEQIFNELASRAASIFGIPIALVAFADSHRIWFKSCIGLSAA